jgi:hypothetical protein
VNDKSRLFPVTIVGVLALTTVLFGFLGWFNHDCPTGSCPVTVRAVQDALYRSLLAFGGDAIYLTVETGYLIAARFLGMLTTISAVFALLLAIAAKALIRRYIRRRRGHIVLIGADAFSLSFAEETARLHLHSGKGGGQTTVLDTPDRLGVLGPNLRYVGTRAVPSDLSEPQSYIADLGRAPTRIILGDPDAHINAERAAKLAVAGIDPSIITLRLDDDALARAVHLWSPMTASCKWISESGLTARSLFCDVDFSDLAMTKQQDRVHLAIIGMGSTGFAVAEEAAQRLHHPNLERTRISAIDKEAAEVSWMIRQDYPGLQQAVDFHGPLPLDALHLGPDMHDDELAPMLDAASDVPFTAIIVAAADDGCSARIAMRIRRMQEEKRLLLAPIFVRMRMSGTIGPEPVTNLSEGIFVFGGTSVHKRDVALDTLEHDLGKRMHDAWRTIIRDQRPAEDLPFEHISADRQRSNRRAGIGALDMLRYAGLVPPPQDPHDQLRIQNDAAARIETDADLTRRLQKAEHSRWCAERFCAGWTQAEDGIRDDARRRHSLLVPWEKLSVQERKKDLSNVLALIAAARQAHGQDRARPVWRQRIRIGITGPIQLGLDDHRTIKASARALLKSAVNGPPSSFTLEIVCPNAPGFDRVMATALMEEWLAMAGQPAKLLLAQSRAREMLDQDALLVWQADRPRPDPEDRAALLKEETDLRAEFDAQSAALETAAGGHITRLDISQGRTDTPTDADRVVDLLGLFEISDVVIAGRRIQFGPVTGGAIDQVGEAKVLVLDLPA